ncbi:MAG: WD40 repeat domain-containing protein [Okeania sp. SIO2C9]|nr:WD40 repeat domain-containing protein [Okeania sp. SIO2C9]
MGKFSEFFKLQTPEDQVFYLGNIQSLIESDLEKYYKYMSNFDFLLEKTKHPNFGVQALIEDYDLIEGDNEKVKTLKLIQGALRLSAHILVKDANELAGQLLARLLYFDAPEIKNLLQQISEAKDTRLLSLTPSLNPPDGNLISTLSGHLDSVNAVAVTPDGKFVVSGSSDHTVKKWDLNTATEVKTFTGHTAPVNAVAVTPDGKKVVSGAYDNTIRVWNLETGTEILTFNGHSLPIVAVAITVDGKKVVSASVANINSIKVWDLETGKEELTLKGHKNLVRTIAITRYEVISGGDSGIIKFWSLKNGKFLSQLDCYNSIRYSKHPKPDVCKIAATFDGSLGIAVDTHNNLILWNAKTNQHIYTKESFYEPNNYTNSIVDLALTPDGTRFISASWDKTLKVWETKSSKEILTFTGHNDSIYAVITTPDSKKLISASKDKTLKVWNLDSVEKNIHATNNISVNDVTITPDGKQVLFGLKNNIIMAYNLASIEQINKFNIDKNRHMIHKFISTIELFWAWVIFILLFFILGILLFFASFILLFKLLPELIVLVADFFGLSVPRLFALFMVSPCVFIFQKLFLEGGNTKIKSKNIAKSTKYSDTYSYLLLGLSELGEKQIIGLAATTDNHELIFISNINMMWSPYFLTVWSLKEKNRISDLRTPLQFIHVVLYVLCILIFIVSVSFLFVSQKISLFGICSMYIILLLIVLFFYESITTILITPNKKYLISGSTKGTINIWNLQNKKLLFVFKGHWQQVTALAITPDGKYLISGSKGKTIKIWNLETRKELFTLKGHGDSINTISVTPDGKHLISGSRDKTIKIWNLENRKEIFTFTGHTDSINSVKVTSDGKLVISASSDKTIQVWEFKTGTVIAKFTGESEINCCAVAPDDVTIVAGEEAGNIHFLRLEGMEA